MKGFMLAAVAFVFGAATMAQSSVSLDGNTVSVKFTGAKVEATPIAFQTAADLVFKGVTVPKGSYSLYVVQAAGKPVLAINKATGTKAAAYDPKLDIGRAPLSVAKAPAPATSPSVKLNKVAALAAKLEIASGDTVSTTQFRLDRVGGDSEW